MELSLAPDIITHIGQFPITNTLLMAWLVMSTLIIIGYFATTHLSLRPGKLQNATEFILETMYDLCTSVSPTYGRTFLPIVVTFFLFIITANWFGLVPGLNAIGLNMHVADKIEFIPLFRSAASDLNTTLAFALISVVLTQYFGIRFKGLYGYIRHFFHNPLHGGIAFVLLGLFIGVFVGMLEVVSEFVKVVSLSFRLFGNVYAGEVVIHTISGLSSYIAPVPFLLLETIVGAVQAVVFALLSLVFFSIISEKPVVEEGAH